MFFRRWYVKQIAKARKLRHVEELAALVRDTEDVLHHRTPSQRCVSMRASNSNGALPAQKKEFMNLRTKDGTTYYEVDINALCKLIVSAGLAEKIVKPQPVIVAPIPARVRWGVGRGPYSGRPFIQRIEGQTTNIFDGPADQVKSIYSDVPDSILAEYRTALSAPTEEERMFNTIAQREKVQQQ